MEFYNFQWKSTWKAAASSRLEGRNAHNEHLILRQ